MRVVLALALAFLLVLPSAPAQSTSEGAALLEDGGDDLVIVANGVPSPAPAGQFGPADLLGLAIEESRLEFVLRLSVADLQPDAEGPLLQSTNYVIDFRHNDVVYRVYAFRSMLTEVNYFASLATAGSAPFTDIIAELPITYDVPTATIAVTVSRDLLVDTQGSAPFPGRSLTGFHVRSASFIDSQQDSQDLGPASIPFPTFSITDSMPDTGNGTLDWAIRFGVGQTGAIRLASAVPTRASNGEATTFLFEVNATNSGPTQRFVLGTTGVPSTWHVELPSESIEIYEHDTVHVPVLVSTPFAHEHGKLQSFVFEAKGSANGDDVGRVQLGVRYTQPPQPAGHHSTVYLHTAPAQGEESLNTALGAAFGQEFKELYFNTQAPADDPNDRGIPVGGQFNRIDPGPPPQMTYVWRIPLSPGLEMGMDFDLAAVGTVNVAVDSLLPLPGAVLTGRLVHSVPDGTDDCSESCTIEDFYFGYGEHTTVATIGPGPAVEVPPNAVGVAVGAPITALAAGDYLPFQAGAGLGLELSLTFTRVDPIFGPHDAPKLSGGEAVLPLLEYHDPVDQVFSSLAGLMIVVSGEAERLVNPGETLLFDLGLMNHGTEAASYDLELSGGNKGWAFIVGDAHVTVRPGETRQLGIAVTAPAGAADGELADLVFAAVDAKDPTARTLARLVAIVDTDMDHIDDASRVPGLQDRLTSKDSPAPTGAVLLASLAAIAIALRRRRHA
ncbi:MAG: hypothetical protein QOC71_1560 [Thermoplasmata archaeon]|nr:hypothetical protein [Thermoplasmata archaeon]